MRAGKAAVAGGYVVRDQGLEELYGRYVYADTYVGQLRSLVPGLPVATGDRSEGHTLPFVSSFGEDACGRVYVVSLVGPVYRLGDGSPAPCVVDGVAAVGARRTVVRRPAGDDRRLRAPARGDQARRRDRRRSRPQRDPRRRRGGRDLRPRRRRPPPRRRRQGRAARRPWRRPLLRRPRPRPPALLLDPGRVGAAVVDAIERGRAEIDVAPLVQRRLTGFAHWRPHLAARLSSAGAAKVGDRVARGQSGKR